MTNKEIRDFLKSLIEMDDEQEEQNILSEVLEAVHKQIPRTVRIERWIYTKCKCGYDFSVHHGDGYYSVPYEKRTKYCPNCGQKLDWGE